LGLAVDLLTLGVVRVFDGELDYFARLGRE
jgi:hypothetical protein